MKNDKPEKKATLKEPGSIEVDAEPRPAPAVPAASAPAVPVAAEPVQNQELAVVSADVYLLLKHPNLHPMLSASYSAGFRSWAISRRLGPRTIPEWNALWDEFNQRPV